MSNSTARYDSYNWKLSSLCFENNMLFNLAYLDRDHSFFIRILIFDDIFWFFQKSPTLNPEIFPKTLE